MPFYRLEYRGKEKDQLLPDQIDKYTSKEELDAFAKELGDGEFDWSHVELKEITNINKPLSQINWTPFKNALKDEDALFDYPWDVFKKRIKAGYMAAIVNEDNKVTATVNIIPKLTDQLKTILHVDPSDPDDQPQVFETGAGWNEERYRGQGIYNQLRNTLIDNVEAEGRLVFSESKGKGASNVNIRNGWTLVNWETFPFAASLMGWVNEEEHGKFQLAAGKVIDLPAKGLYNGNTVDTGESLVAKWTRTRDWSQHLHLWVNDFEKLRKFEGILRAQAGLDPESEPHEETFALNSWRNHVAYCLFQDRTLLGETDATRKAWREFSKQDRTFIKGSVFAADELPTIEKRGDLVHAGG